MKKQDVIDIYKKAGIEFTEAERWEVLRWSRIMRGFAGERFSSEAKDIFIRGFIEGRAEQVARNAGLAIPNKNAKGMQGTAPANGAGTKGDSGQVHTGEPDLFESTV